MNTEFFDVRAQASESDIAEINKLPWQQKIDLSRRMVRSLLVDRFKLKTETTTRELPVYALVVAKGGSKLKSVVAVDYPPVGVKPVPGANYRGIGKTGPGPDNRDRLFHAGPRRLAVLPVRNGNRVVIDKTGLKGDFSFVLNGTDIDGTAQNDATTISLFTALQEQLGLKLEPQKAPVEVIVIDHVERPSAN